jgi:hypothetical protein
MQSRRPSSQMPPLGTVVADETGATTIAARIEAEQQRRTHP